MSDYQIVIYRYGRYSGKIIARFWRSDLHSAVIAGDHWASRLIKHGHTARGLVVKIFDDQDRQVHKIEYN